MKRLRTSKQNPCPVCRNDHGCAIREDNRIECLRSISENDAPQGYRFIKLLPNGMGGLFAEATDQAEPRQQERQQRQKKAAAERAKGALPVPELTLAYAKLHRYLGLGSRHRQDLRDRGLTDAQINVYLAFSVYPDQELPPGIPANLPGVTRRGDRLYAKGTGYACPSFDLEGRVNGWQIRYDNPDEVGGKYHWAVNPRLPSKELPITVCRPVDGVKRPGLRLAEGFLKPFIAAQKTGQITIGSPNGQFAASPEQTLAALEAYCTDNTVAIAPDKGDVRNHHVMQRWAGQIEWLKGQGYTVRVEWWGQTDKTHPDIDELTGDEAIAYISPDDFYAIAREHGGISENPSSYTSSIGNIGRGIGEPDPDTYAQYIAWEEEQERIGEAQAEEGFTHWIKNRLKQLRRLANWQKSAFGSGKELPPVQPASQPTAKYHPDKPLPRPSDFAGQGLPRIIFEQGQRLEVLAKLKELGWKLICDRSFTGSGKSHDAGLLHFDPDGTNKIWYFDQNHTNPSTEPIEAMMNMEPRHNGMVSVEGKFTPRGNPHLKWAKGDGDEVVRIASVCINSDLFVKFKGKGWNVDAEKELVIIEAEDGGQKKSVARNPICKQCRFAYKCHSEIGKGYGYLYQRRQTMEVRRIRASLDSAPNPAGENKYDYSGDIAFVEEASRHIKGIKSLSAWANELAQLWGYVERKAPEAFEALQPIRFALQDALSGNFDRIEKGMNRGVDHESLIENLPSPDVIANLPELIERVREAMPSIKDLVEEPDSVVGLGGEWRSIGQFARNTFKVEAARQTKENIEALPPNVLVDLLEIWAGLKPGSLRVCGKKLHITVPDTRHADILKACGVVVLLDATPDLPKLEKILGDRVLQIEQERLPQSNLTVINVDMRGMGSKQISDTCKSRQLALLDWIEQQYQEVRVLANKSDTHLPLDGWWFNDNRGSNAFKGVEALAAFNTPRPNVGTIEDEYRALFGSLEGFDDYYQRLIRAEIVQLVGRNRAHLYPDKQFIICLVGTNQDLSFLTSEYSLTVVSKEAFELCPEAGSSDQITRWKILQAVGQLQDRGQKLTQEAIASLTGKSQELISKISKEFGGWRVLKKLLLALLGLYRGGNNFSELTDEEKWLAESYLPGLLDESPEIAVEEVGALIRTYGLSAFLRILTAASPRTQTKLLALAMQALPATFQLELMALIEGGG